MKGEVVYLYAFDVANEIMIGKVHEVLANKPVPFEIYPDHTIPKDAPIYKPLSIELAPLTTLVSGQSIRPLIHVYEIGVISIAMRVSIEVATIEELMPFHNPILTNGQSISQVAGEICKEAYESLKEVMVKGSIILEPEAYTAFCITDIGEKQDLNKWMEENRNKIAELLTENKPGVLSQMQVDEVLRIQYSYANTDLTIIDWDAAFVVDLTGYVDDVLYVLELANLQLEEYLVMDQRLDSYLNQAYEDVKIHNIRLFGSSPKILRTLRILRVDVTRLNDEVTNITKFFGDWYLARVYLGAHERFHLEQWRNSVGERLKQLDSLYSVVSAEINNFRMISLETLIVIFFAIDLLMMFFFRH